MSLRRSRARVKRVLAPGLLLTLLGACTVGPDYQRPDAPVPQAYKEAWKPGPLDKGWAPMRPNDAIDRGHWWSIYNDPVLDGLVRQIDITNQNLKAAEANFREAEAIVAEARAGLFPTLDLDAAASRSRGSGGSGGGVVTSNGTVVGGGGGGGRIGNQFSTTMTASWVPDLWGKVRRQIESNEATAQSDAATLANTRLAAQASLVTDYLQLRVADELQRLLADEVKAFTNALQIVTNQYHGGTTDQSAVSQAQAQLESTRAQLIAVGVSRAQFEHAIAVLIGKPPAELTIAPVQTMIAVPRIPPGMPSALLERRPDIASAERSMAAANAQIGVAVAAFYPQVTLSGDYGVSSSMLRKLFTDSSRIWSFGSSLAQTVFDGGLNNATVAQDKAAYEASVANYRQTVLTAIQQVEDQLVGERLLADEAVTQDAAVKAAREAQRIITNQYLGGTQAYTAVIVAEETALTDEVTAVNIRQSRLVTSAALIEALGGGWDAAQLPGPEKIENDQPLNFNPIPPTFPNGSAGITPPLQK
jgi:NodT family efflux transporter outer membrane factor (OMF) lipoprotein